MQKNKRSEIITLIERLTLTTFTLLVCYGFISNPVAVKTPLVVVSDTTLTIKDSLIDSIPTQIKTFKASSKLPTRIGNYIEKYYQFALEGQQQYGVPVAITLAQGIIESACGTSKLSINKNNHFGIKDKSGSYRYYDCVEESFIHHSKVLSKRYMLNTSDYVLWAHNLQKKGYAEDPNYAKTLILTIKKYHLDKIV